jgi:hypothetical protein
VGVNSQVFRSIERTIGSQEEPVTFVGIISAEKLYTRALENYVSVAISEMKLRPPFVIELGAVGLKGVYMGAPHPEFSSGHCYGPFREESLVRRYDLQDSRHAGLLDILRQFLDELYDLAECFRSDVLTDDHVRKNDIPPRG